MSALLVIGNGFDLFLEVKSKYSDYFNSKEYQQFKKEVEWWKAEIDTNGYRVANKTYTNNSKITCWDILFYLHSPGEKNSEKIKWCDVEETIHESFLGNSKKAFYWDKIYQLLHEYYYGEQTSIINNISKYKDINKILIMFFIINDWKEHSKNKEKFYKKLLDELNTFEKRFGKYISAITNEESYSHKANILIANLAPKGCRQVDSFNYSKIDYQNIQINHINGDVNNPIFGIDDKKSELKRIPELRFFTKTSRRIYQDSYGKNKTNTNRNNTGISETVVFGHSLNKQDYDYFYYLFTKMKFNASEIEQMGKISFLFYVYDENRRAEIINNYTESVYQLINQYEEDTNKNSHKVLLNLLRFSGKLIIKEIMVKPSILKG